MVVEAVGNPERVRTSVSFTVSGFFHGWALAWVGLLGHGAAEPPKSVYEIAIKPHENRLVWYNLRDRLPEVAPAKKSADTRPPRALKKFDQSLVAGEKDDDRPPQMISVPAPEIETPKMLPLPNVVAAARPSRAVRLFAPPPEKVAEAPALPEAPHVAPSLDAKPLPMTAPVPRPQPKPFTPPPAKGQARSNPSLPDAPRVAAAIETKPLPIAPSVPRPQPKPFQPPTTKPQPASATLALPDAPRVATVVDAKGPPIGTSVPRPQPKPFTPPPSTSAPSRTVEATLPDGMPVAFYIEARTPPLGNSVPRPQPRDFTPPVQVASARPTPTALPSAPEIGSAAKLPAAAAATLPAAPRPFLLPPAKSAATQSTAPALPDAAPSVNASATGGNEESALAIVGLDPSKTTDFPSPPGSRQAGFSAGPKLRRDGSAGGSSDAQIVVPGLTAKGGVKDAKPTLVASISAPTSRENLLAASRMAMHIPEPSIPAEGPRAARVSTSPDPRLSGRVIYTVAIQMPNVTSYSGSWLVWFAEREPLPGSPTVDMRPPLPLRKVDPKYIAAAADERVQGSVRLAAVIRKSGHVDTVALLNHLDDRLDRSAQEALAKWEFEPALRNGTPVDVDCVFEIPFRLAPRPAK